jgi:hypothetical protein
MEDQSIGPSGGGLEKKEKYVRLRMAGQMVWLGSVLSRCALGAGAIGAFRSKGVETYQLSIIPGDN